MVTTLLKFFKITFGIFASGYRMNGSFEELAKYFPQYLTEHQKIAVAEEFKAFPNLNYYLRRFETEYLQGDCWFDIPLGTVGVDSRGPVAGVILSNSCDIDLGNKRSLPPNVIVSPMLSVDRYVAALEKSGMDKKAIASKVNDIRRQAVTDIMYFPASDTLKDESLIWLSRVYSLPMKAVSSHANLKKIFTLSQIGFYVLTMKLAIHFCRLHEGVARFPEPQPA